MSQEKMLLKQIRVGSRPSRLAQVQVEEVFSLLSKKGGEVAYQHRPYQTQGDQDKLTPLTANVADDFFTDVLDEALLKQDIDVAVHSAKDLPQALRDGLEIFALTVSLDETDAFVGKSKLDELPPGAKVGTSSLLRKNFLLQMNPHVTVVEIRGTIEERLRLVDRGDCEGIVVATVALKRLGLENRIREIFPWEATPLQGQLAVVGRQQDRELKKIFAPIDVRKTYGWVALVGAGPGDPEWMTLKAVKTLKRADCVFYDYLVHPEVLQYAIKAEKINVGKRKGEHTLPQSELCRMLRQKAVEGKNVVRLKGGDPMIFGRGAEEMNYLRSYHIPVAVIPGVSSVTGLPSGQGIPLTARGISSSVAFVSGHGETEDSQSPQPIVVPKADTLVFLMGLTKLSLIVQTLRQEGWKESTPFMIISKGTRLDEQIISGTIATIEQLAEEQSPQPPALILVGEVVKFWRPARQSGKILYVGTNPEKYKGLGPIIPFPMIEISPKDLTDQEIQGLVRELPSYDLIIFTSRHAVCTFGDLLKKKFFPHAVLKSTPLAVIGEDTAEALDIFDWSPEIIAQDENSEGLLRALQERHSLKGKRILFPRSSLPNPFLREELSRCGAHVRELVVYENRKPLRRELPAEEITAIIFTSPSTVKNFLEDYGTIPHHWEILSKGVTTQKTLQESGYESEVLVYESF